MKKNNFFKTYFLVILFFSLTFIFDMLTKYFLIGTLIPNEGDSVDFIDGFINFVYVQNKGAGWGILSGQSVLLIVLSIIILAVLIWFYIIKMKQVSKLNTFLSISIGLIVGGCIGNLYDRIFFGFVRDFINFQFMSFPVFNIADISLSVGVVCIVIYFILYYISYKDTEKLKDSSENKDNQ